MPVNFDKPDERKKYVESKFSDLLSNINQVYGKELMERLVRRLEKTIEIFDADLKEILRSLDEKEKKFEESLPDIDKFKSDYLAVRSSREETENAEGEKSETPEGQAPADDDDDDIIRKIENRRKKR